MPTKKVYEKVKKLERVEKPVESYTPKDAELKTRDYIKRRVDELKKFRKNVLGKDIEAIWKSADNEYQPEEIKFGMDKRKRFETDDVLGLRTRLVPIVGDQQNWRSQNSDPTLLVKIQTAISIIIDRDPEAVFQALTKKYDATTSIAQALYKTSWMIDKSKQQLKLFCFNLAKYGWAVGRSYPRILKNEKSILTQMDTEKPEKNVYEKKIITRFNGVHRENLDPYRTWIDEMARPNEHDSMHEGYFEKDYSKDSFDLEFGHYSNAKFVMEGMKLSPENEQEQEHADERKDIVTVGFFESDTKDLYGILVPSQHILLYSSPLPNDDGRLSFWHTYWNLRDARTPYGIGLWEIIKQNKTLYDKMKNMTMDQLVLSIYKMFFMSGTSSTLVGDGTIKIQPGKGVQNLGGKVDFLEIPGPGRDSWEGLAKLYDDMDNDTGITKTLQGEITGKTLGEILHAKESALKRMNVPIDNIAQALSEEAYISLSWLSQILSTPEVKEFTDEEELMKYEQETGINRFEMTAQVDAMGMPTNIMASFLPEVPLNLDYDKDSESLIESKESRFFQIGKDIQQSQVKWEGIITVVPKSLLAPSAELEKERKLQLFNILVPLLGQPPEIFFRAVKQILKVNDEDIEDWLPDTWIMFANGQGPMQPLFINPLQQLMGGGQQMPGGSVTGPTMQGGQGMAPQQAGTVVPKGQAPGNQMTPSIKRTMGQMSSQ